MMWQQVVCTSGPAKDIQETEGKIHGNLSCTHACLHGTIIGDAYVKEELTLKANCVMQGNIYTTKLEIESQAKFNGSCNTNDTSHEIKLLEAVTE